MKLYTIIVFVCMGASVYAQQNTDNTDNKEKMNESVHESLQKIQKEVDNLFDHVVPPILNGVGSLIDHVHRVRDPFIEYPYGLKNVAFEKKDTGLAICMKFEKIKGAIASERVGDTLYLQVPVEKGTVHVTLKKNEIRFKSRIEDAQQADSLTYRFEQFTHKITRLPIVVDIAKEPFITLDRTTGDLTLELAHDATLVPYKVPVHEMSSEVKNTPLESDKK